MKEGLVSTIIPVHNRPAAIREAVDSVLRQTYRPVEVVIVDDGSTDDTGRVCQSLADAQPSTVRYVRRENGGPGQARNTGLAQAQGEFIQYLDSDDLLVPEKFACQVEMLRKNTHCGVCYGITKRPYCSRPDVPWARTGETFHRILPEFLLARGWDTASPLWRRQVCDAIGPWSSLRTMEDWEHDCRAGIAGVRPIHCPKPLSIVRDHDGERASGHHLGFTSDVLRDYYRAHRSVHNCLREAGLVYEDYLRQFSRKLFWIARMCGQRGLLAEAEGALDMALENAGLHGPTGDLMSFRAATRVFGWRATVGVSESVRRLLGRHRTQVPVGFVVWRLVG